MDSLETSRSTNVLLFLGGFVGVITLYFIGFVVRRLYFEPLSKIPGPKLNALTRLPQVIHMNNGTTVENVQALHEKYGEVVRLSPNEISFTSGESAWPEIYGFRTGKMKGHSSFQKDRVWFPQPVNGAPSILLADDANHSRMRKVWSHSFSEKALQEQEGLLQKYVDQLVDGLREQSRTGQTTNIVKWYNWTTFDVIADLLFGEPFGCLQDKSTHKHIDLLFRAIMAFKNYYISVYYPLLKRWLNDPSLLAARIDFFKWITDQTRKRLDRETDRPDLISKMKEHNGKDMDEVMSFQEIVSNCNTILGAGSETTATLLSGTTFHLLKNPAVFQKLKEEIRGKFKTYDDITMAAVNDCPYLIAVLSEGLRLYPPVPTGFPRVVPPGGEVVSGYYLPENTSVCMSSWPLGHSEANFRNAESMRPERWLGDEKYNDDKRHLLQPFSFGPRACLGRNLAYAEMRLILAKVVWSFDFKLHPSGERWLEENTCYTLFKKPDLPVYVTEVVRS